MYSAAEHAAVDKLLAAIDKAGQYNPWFTQDFIRQALTNLVDMLDKEGLKKMDFILWKHQIARKPKTIAVVMAGNIPAVGFHDALCVLTSGNKLLAKLSSDDQYLLPALTDLLAAIEPAFKDRVSYTTERIQDFDGVIATGSNNSARYFEYYFAAYPHIIRHNRNGLAVLDGAETDLDLTLLGSDVFMFLALGAAMFRKFL